MSKKIQALYGLKFNPFSPDIPASSLFVSPAVEQFCWRVEQQTSEGGFALITGEPGTGKSTSLRILADRLNNMRDITLGILTRSQATVADFYRELGHLFNVPLAPHNRWNSARVLREKWQNHIENALTKPVLFIDEAQEMSSAVLCELRLLASADLDSRSLLFSVLSGDNRLSTRLQQSDLLPIASRIRSRLRHEHASPEQLLETLTHLLKEAGNPSIMSESVQKALAEHAIGNYRVLSNMANDLLVSGARKDVTLIDDKLFFEVFDPKGVASAARRINTAIAG